MIHVLGNLPEEYESKVETLEKDLDSMHDPLTIERMTNELNLKYKKICQKNNYDPDEEENEKKKENKGTALTTAGYPRFKGDASHTAISDIRVQTAPARKITQKMTQEKSDSMSNVHIVGSQVHGLLVLQEAAKREK